MTNSYHSLFFEILAVGMDRNFIKKFEKIAQHYHCNISFVSSIDFVSHSQKKYYHVFFISQDLEYYINIIETLSIKFPRSICVVLINDIEKFKILDNNLLFFILDSDNILSFELALHQLYRWILKIANQKLGVDTSIINIAGGKFSILYETYEKNGSVFQLTSKQVAIMKILLQYRGEVVSRLLLLDTIWTSERKIVTDRIIDTNIVALRKILGDNAKKPQYLQTIFGQGYRLICD